MITPAIHTPFNEDQWLRLPFLLSDTQRWVEELGGQLFARLPLADKRKLFRKTYYLSATACAHIMERHYYKLIRHPGAGKFTIPVAEILHWLREGGSLPAVPLSGSLNYIRVVETPEPVGTDINGLPTRQITILTDSGGNIVTAFPGRQEG